MNESSTQDAPPNEVSQGEASEAAAEAAAPTPPPEVIEEPPIAPDVPRMARPQGSAKVSPTSIPSPVFLAVVAVFTFAADVVTKLWAEQRLQGYPGYIRLIDDHLMLVLAKNKGGAWGLLQGQSEHVRRPFFLLVSIAAIAFIVTLYRRLQPHQRALKWGLPLVLGGALGNVFDRIRYGYVIDFIDYRADWIKKLNELVQKNVSSHIVTDHWPTFNIADVAICAGVALMAIDMLTARRGKPRLAPDVPLQPVNEPVTEPAVEGAPASEALAAEAAESGESSATTPEGEPAPSEATDAPAPRDEAESGGSPPPRDEH